MWWEEVEMLTVVSVGTGFRNTLSETKLSYQKQSWNRTAGNCSVNFIWQRLLPASERMLKMLP